MSNTAITLVALIITIIILLILAGITLNMIMGENSIINKSTIAKEKTKEQSALEKLNLKLLEYNSDKIDNKNISLEEYLNSIEGCTEVNKDETEDNPEGYIVVIDGYEFRVDASGKVIENLEKSTSPEISLTQSGNVIDISIKEREEIITNLEIINSDGTVEESVTKENMTQEEEKYTYQHTVTTEGTYTIKVATRKRKLYKKNYN